MTTLAPLGATPSTFGYRSSAVPSAPSLAATKRPPTSGGAADGAQLLRVASFNVENFFDTVDDPAPLNDTVLTDKQYRHKLDKVSLAVRDALKAPDIVTFQEIENESVLRDIAAHPALKGLGYEVAIMPSNDVRNINVAVMYRADKLSVTGVRQYNPDTMEPLNDNPTGQLDMDKLYARPPLVVDFSVPSSTGSAGATDARAGAQALTVIVNHFKSKLGGDKPEARRQLQGKALGEFVDELRTKRPDVPVLATGDFNATFEDGAYKKLIRRSDGSQRFYDTTMTVPEDERYTYIYKGRPDMLDHMLVTDDLNAAHAGTTIAHFNTGPENASQAGNPKVPNGASDHDVIVASFDLSKLGAPANPAPPAKGNGRRK